MMRVLVVLIILCLVPVGCSSKKYWTKDNFNAEQFARENFWCQQQARIGAYPMVNYSNDASVIILNQISQRQIYSDCMRSLGYYIVEKK